MKQKNPSLGVNEFQSSFKTFHSEAPNHPKYNSMNTLQKKLYSNQIMTKTPLNNTNNTNSTNFFSNENLNISNNIIKLNNSLENEYNNNQNHIGRWTDEEHQKFIEGILEYGNEWKKVQQIIKTRSSTQARSHAQKFFLRVKKLIKNNGGNFNINEKDKIFESIINTILPNKKGETLTKSQKEKLLSAISSNIKYEGEIKERSDNHLQMGLVEEEENLKYKKENNENNIKAQKKGADIRNLSGNNNLFIQRKTSLGQKRKLTTTDSRDQIFIIEKDKSHKPSIDISSQIININEKNDNINKNIIKINNLNENNTNNNNKINDNNKNNSSNVSNNNNILNVNNNNDNNENKNNMNGCIINNYINVTNNFMNNKYICNFYSNDIFNNNYQDYTFYDKNDSINNDRNFNCFGIHQCPEKSIYNLDKSFLFGNQFNKTFYNNFNFINNRVNNYNENDINNSGTNPFELNFNNFNNENYNNNINYNSNENYSNNINNNENFNNNYNNSENYNNNDNYNNNENEQQISIQEEEFIKLNNNNNIDDNNEYN